MSTHQDRQPTQPGVVGTSGRAAVVPLTTALEEGTDLRDASWRVATDYAVRGESLEQLLDDVDRALGDLGGSRARDDVVRALAVAWSETVLGSFHRLACTDPLTGLASTAHLVTQLEERSRSLTDLALLVVDVPIAAEEADREAAALGGAVAALEVRRAMDAVLPGCRTPARVAEDRCALLVDRASTGDDVPRRLADELATRLAAVGLRRAVRVRLLPLPDDLAAASDVVDALCR